MIASGRAHLFHFAIRTHSNHAGDDRDSTMTSSVVNCAVRSRVALCQENKLAPEYSDYHNSNRVKLPQLKEGRIPFFRIGALLILLNGIEFLSCTLHFAVVEFFRFSSLDSDSS